MKGYYTYPEIRGNTLLFVSDDDLWKMDLTDMKPQRLTYDIGVVTKSRISPDGRNVAFLVTQIGNGYGINEVFVVSIDGGIPKRLTYFGSRRTDLVGWLDNERVILTSDYLTPFPSRTDLFTVSVSGGMPERLPYGQATDLVIGNGITVLSRYTNDLQYWKRYKGGTKGVLYISRDGRNFQKFLELNGNINSPMIVGDRLYFISDFEGFGNIYSVDFNGNDMRKHTNLNDYYARNARSDGRRIVFQSGGQVYLMVDDNIQLLDIDIPTIGKKRMPKFVDVKIGDIGINGDVSMIGITSRGKPFIMRPWDGPVFQLGEKNGVRYKFVEISGRRVVTVSDETGEERVEIHELPDDGKRRVDVDFGRIENMRMSPDGKYLLLSNHKFEIWLLNLDDLSYRMIDKSEYGIIWDIAWHPKSYMFAYTFREDNFAMSIKMGNVDGKTWRVTTPTSIDYSPSFDKSGKYLYFLSRRHLDPVYDRIIFNLSFPLASKPYMAILGKGYSPFDGSPDEEFIEDPEGVLERIVPMPIDESNYVKVVGGNNKVFLLSFPVEGSMRGWYSQSPDKPTGVIEVFDVQTRTKEVFLQGVSDLRMSHDGNKLVVKQGEQLRIVETSKKPDVTTSEPGPKTGFIDLKRVKVYVEPEREWSQMLRETWRLMRDNYWDEKMRGINWEEIYEKYRRLLPRVNTRFELSDVIKEMIGELGTSHTYEIPFDFDVEKPYPIGGLGAELKFESGCYKVVKLFYGDKANEGEKSPLMAPGVEVKEGDCITAIDGVELTKDVNPLSLLINKADQFVTMDILSSGIKRKVYVRTLRDEKSLMYRWWVESNRRYVYEKTNGLVGYVHVPDMGPRGYAEFMRLYPQEIQRRGIIIDVRFNTGGHVSPLLIERLALKRIGEDRPRRGKPVPYPQLAPPEVLVALTNENAGSDGDIFSYSFKRLKLGPLIGKRTWGGVIGITGRHRLVDGTMVSQPEFAFFFDDVGLGVENYGVDPDIEVDILPQDYAVGRDVQLDKAIEVAMERLKAQTKVEQV